MPDSGTRLRGARCVPFWPLLLLALLVLSLWPNKPWAARRDHVRVVLDTSLSLQSNDTRKLAKLSTLLLFDLAHPNLTAPASSGPPESSFEVYPFQVRWPTRAGTKCEKFYPPSPSTATPIAPRGERVAARRDLVSSLAGLPYDAGCTYFHPGLSRAVDSLEKTPGGALDRRVIVLVTDGVPDNRADDLAAIRELLPRMEVANIRLYVLAFGPKVMTDQVFFEDLVSGSGGSPLGKAFFDASGDGLLAAMLDLFAASFGYVNSSGGTRGAGTTVSLLPASSHGGATVKPERAIVVAYHPSPSPPGLKLNAPAAGRLNIDSTAPAGGWDSRGVGSQHGYSLHHVLHPDAGDYRVGPASPASLAVLRPTELVLDLEHVPSSTKGIAVPRVMAGEQIEITVTPRPVGGATADTPQVQISYQGHAGSWDPSDPDFRGSEERGGAPSMGVGAGGLRSYAIYPVFERQPLPGERFYTGYLEVEATLGAAIVGALKGNRSYPVHVWPRLRVLPAPAVGDAVGTGRGSVALRRGQKGCAPFMFDVDVGPEGNRLPELTPPDRYPLRAVLDAGVKLEGALAGAIVTLDGRRLEVDGAPGPVPSDWSNGRKLTAADFVEGKHEVCLQLGKPAAGASSLQLPIRFTLLSAPYDEFDVVQPFTLRASIAPPTWVERWGKLVVLTLLALALLALFWYLRRRPDLPSDLGYAVGPWVSAADSIAPSFRAFPEQGRIGRLLALVHKPSLLSSDQDRVLGRVEPVDGELYRFLPAGGVHLVEEVEATGKIPRAGGGISIRVQRRYRVRVEDGREEVFRLEYQL